ncbi:EAL domain-containing protein [Pengzhenrongella phosphoraccumulans]|uniref:sensor domain-containing protein n=1 Tax=Pengzhenrongella phosphoraccumulans TaxID=3114394 RepID=UPI00388FC6E2
MHDDAGRPERERAACPAGVPSRAPGAEAVAALTALPDPVFILHVVQDDNGAVTELVDAYRNDAADRLCRESVLPSAGGTSGEMLPWVTAAFDQLVAAFEADSPKSFDVPCPLQRDPGCVYSMTATRLGASLLVSAAEITEQRRAEAGLAEVAWRFQMLAENSSDFVIQVGREGEVLWASPSVTGALGWRPDELVGQNRMDFVHPDDRSGQIEAAERIATGERDARSVRVRRQDGSYRWFARTWRPILDSFGAADGSVAGFRDVQAEIESEQALSASEERYRLVAENASDFVALAQSDGAMIWVSPAVTRSTGWAPEDLVGRSMDYLIHPDDLAATTAERGALLMGHEVTHPSGGFLTRVRTKSGGWRWMSGSGTPVSEGASFAGVVASIKDVDDLVRAREEAVADRAHLRATVDSLLDPHVLLTAVRDDSGLIVDFEYADANPAACEYNQIAYADLIGAHLLDVFTAHAGTELLESYRQVVETGEPLALDEVSYVHEILGTERRYDIRASQVGDGISLTWRDVTDRHAAVEALARSEELYRVLAENASDVVLRLEPDGTFAWVSDPITELLGWQRADVVGHEIDDFIHPDDLARFREIDAETPRGRTTSVDVRFRCADSSYRWMACRIRVELTPEGVSSGFVGALVDIADRKSAEELLSFSASHDALTGLANRALLLEEIDRALAVGRRSGRATGLLLVDLDHFKNVNDALGHTVGDELLRAVAARIAATVRAGDLVARHGGDEFVVLQRELRDVGDARQLAERLVLESRKSLTIGDMELFATASVGVAVVVPGIDPVRDAVDLIREADTAMYAAKVAGRDRVAQFNDDLQRSVDDRLHLEGELRHALARDQLAVWYQPEVDLHDGTVRAAEALLRWHHPDGNVRPAAQFIEVAEDSGLILDIGAWVLREACAAAALWTKRDPSHRVVLRVNLSPLELGQPELIENLDAALAASGLGADLLCVEITEMAMLSDSATVRANLEAIRERGIDLAIDDFGTGYGSLSYLRRYSVDVMKVDRSFVTGITTDTQDRMLVAGVIALADRLGISVTAEGVESLAQARVLASIGCAGAQGYLYSPALEIGAFAEFLRAREPVEPA